MDITFKEFCEVLDRLQKDCNNRDTKWAEEGLGKDIGLEFDAAYQTAVAAFVTQKGNQEDVDVLRNYLKEAYSGSNLAVEFKQ